MKPVSFQGEIASLALADVVQNLAANKKTGTLAIHSQEGTHHIQFNEGKILAYGDDRGFSIAQWLADKDIVPHDRLEEALRRYRRAKRKSLGQILNDLKLLDEEEYRSYLVDLVQETLYEVLSFREGSFEFEDDELTDELIDREVKSLSVEFPAASIVMEAARRMDDWENIRHCIPSENEIYHVPPGSRERFLEEAPDDITRDAIELLDGTRTIRQVIAQLPYSRFEGSRAVAALVGEKRIRPLDSSRIMKQGSTGDTPQEDIACLRTVLEREPNNRQILERLAKLYEKTGDHGESVTFYKLLAISLFEEEKLEQAETCLRKALQLNSKDIATWQRLWEVVRKQADNEKTEAFGLQFAAHFKKLGLCEVAQDILVELTKLFPKKLLFRIELADVRFSLGEKKACIAALFEVARELVNAKRYDEAESVFGRILKYDRDNRRAKEYYEKIRSGKLARRRETRRRILRRTLAFLVFVAVCGFFTYDVVVRRELLAAHRGIIDDALLENGLHGDAIKRIDAVRQRHPYSLAARLEADTLLRALRKGAAGGQRKPLVGSEKTPPLKEAKD